MRINSNQKLQADANVLISLLLSSDYDYKIAVDSEGKEFLKIKFKSGNVYELHSVYDFLLEQLKQKGGN